MHFFHGCCRLPRRRYRIGAIDSVDAVWEPSPDGEGSYTGDGCCSSLVSPANDARLTQPVTFDWTDASGAASYTIQIDDSSAFSAPIVLSQTVTPSQLTTGSIPGANVDRWWRVRANGPTGVAGAWSSTRRFRTTTGPVATSTTTAPPATTTTLPPPPTTTTTVPADTVAVQIAEYDTAKRVLHVGATSTSSTVTLTVTVTASSAVIGTLGNDGGGYRGDLAWSVNPQNITVRSSRGGVATRAVAAK